MKNTEKNCHELAAHIISGWNFEMLEEWARAALARTYMADSTSFSADLGMSNDSFELSEEVDLKKLLRTLLDDDHGVSTRAYGEITKWLHANKFDRVAEEISSEVDATDGRWYVPSA